ncbi:hypothetical protein TRICHSKD4_3476 [Roseibium sp. TrichSKD4]|uniref:hypothetical protein n=1 Tax=Roseibium sp. TrichSKD4 TaxID=744980 RepID=UPI0001E567B7|nr:hypothetical protein [Roseibium sp. TrichSKD4]EFO31245.1 hypothetical protein TRICHSKD4_3476 [Roseibium sp. TrichSKD4]
MPAPTSGQTPSKLCYRVQPGTSGYLVVVFSQVRVPPGKFGLERLFAGTRHACLFFNDPRNRWYLDQQNDIGHLIDKTIDTQKPSRIIYYGSSMGGTAALHAGLSRRDGDIHAFGAELLTGQPGSQSLEHGISAQTADFLSLETLAEANTPHSVHLYYGGFDGTDAANVARAADNLSQTYIHLLASTHASHDHLYSRNVIRQLIKTFDRDPQTLLVPKSLLLDADLASLSAFGRLWETFSKGETLQLDELKALPIFNSNPGLQWLYAEAVSQNGDVTKAAHLLEHLDQAIEAQPVWRTLPKRWRKQIPLRRADMLLDAGYRSQAAHVLEDAFVRFSADDRMRSLAKRAGFSKAEKPTD